MPTKIIIKRNEWLNLKIDGKIKKQKSSEKKEFVSIVVKISKEKDMAATNHYALLNVSKK